MIAFRVAVNRKRMCVAGIGKDGVLTAIVDYVADKRRSKMSLAVGGLYSPTEEHAMWKSLALTVGDRVEITVIETESPDKPTKRYRRDPKTSEKSQRAYVRAYAKKFGWKILTQTKKSK